MTDTNTRAADALAPISDDVVKEESIFCDKVWEALKGDHNDLRRQQIILNAFRTARAALNAIGGKHD
jgi:hypothetical protein